MVGRMGGVNGAAIATDDRPGAPRLCGRVRQNARHTYVSPRGCDVLANRASKRGRMSPAPLVASDADIFRAVAHRPLTVDLRAGTATGQGHDRLRGVNGVFTGSDADLILGGAHDDEYLSGGGGADTIRGRRGTDYVSGHQGRDRLWGGADTDVIEGGGGRDVMFAGGGDDYLRGWHGDDLLYGGPGTDDLRGGDGTDTCVSGTRLNCERP